MQQNLCLGEIETVGFAAAVEAADVAVKTANVELLGYELAGGGGFVAVKIQGQVGAVRAAVLAAAEAAGRVNEVHSTQIIPRPSTGIEPMVRSEDTVGLAQPEPPEPPAAPQPPAGPKPPKPSTPPAKPVEPVETRKPVEPSPTAVEPVETKSSAEPVETKGEPPKKSAPRTTARKTTTSRTRRNKK